MVHKFDVFVLALVLFSGIILLTMVIFAKQKKIVDLEIENKTLRFGVSPVQDGMEIQKMMNDIQSIQIDHLQKSATTLKNHEIAEFNKRALRSEKWREEFDEFE